MEKAANVFVKQTEIKRQNIWSDMQRCKVKADTDTEKAEKLLMIEKA